jgi:hypothetical protein
MLPQNTLVPALAVFRSSPGIQFGADIPRAEGRAICIEVCGRVVRICARTSGGNSEAILNRGLPVQDLARSLVYHHTYLGVK